MKTKVMMITPEKAKEMLEHNTKNRTVSRNRVEVYADEMKRGEWLSNGEAICFNESGELVNGQHRLMAVVKSGCTVEMVVVFGVKDDVTLYDRGRMRSASDALTLSGIHATTRTVALARLYIYQSEGRRNPIIPESKIKDFHINHADSIGKAIEIAKSTNKTRGVNLNAAYFMLALVNAYEFGVQEDTLRKFCNIVRSGFYDDDTQLAAVVIRNDIITGNIVTGKGVEASINNSYMVENAIRDFTAGYKRRKTYKNTTSRVYGKDKG